MTTTKPLNPDAIVRLTAGLQETARALARRMGQLAATIRIDWDAIPYQLRVDLEEELDWIGEWKGRLG